ncbi:MAG: preprotein translocase subunit SecG [Pseudomonadota bacterium]
MNTFLTLIIVVQVLSALTIIGLVLLQHGKGADMGAAFGSGASGSLFGATGSSNFLSKSTGVAAAIFFAATLGLAYLGNRPASNTGGVMDKLPVPAVPAAPAAGTAPATPAVPAPGATVPVPAPAGSATAPAPSSGAGAGTSGQSNQIPK